MSRRLSSLFLLLVLAGGAFAGTPFMYGKDEMSAMKCCKRMKMNVASAQAAQLCCVLNCNEPSPVAPGSTTNFSTTTVSITDSIVAQIASLFNSDLGRTAPVLPRVETAPLKKSLQPSYIKHHSFLI